MRFISRCNPDKKFDPFVQEPSCKNEAEYQRLLKVFGVVEKAVLRRAFTSQHTVGIVDKSVLEDRFFGVHPGNMGTEQSIKSVHNDSAPDTFIARDNFVLVIDHFCFDCTKWSRKGSPLQALLSKHGDQVSSLSGNELIEFVRSSGIRCSEKDHIENLSQMIKAKVEKARMYFNALNRYLVEEDRTKQKELWLFAERFGLGRCYRGCSTAHARKTPSPRRRKGTRTTQGALIEAPRRALEGRERNEALPSSTHPREVHAASSAMSPAPSHAACHESNSKETPVCPPALTPLGNVWKTSNPLRFPDPLCVGKRQAKEQPCWTQEAAARQ